MKQGWETTQEERIQIAKDCIASGKNYGEMTLKYQVSYQQVRTQIPRFEQMGQLGQKISEAAEKKTKVPVLNWKSPNRNRATQTQLYLAEMENALLKRLDEIEGRDAWKK